MATLSPSSLAWSGAAGLWGRGTPRTLWAPAAQGSCALRHNLSKWPVKALDLVPGRRVCGAAKGLEARQGARMKRGWGGTQAVGAWPLDPYLQSLGRGQAPGHQACRLVLGWVGPMELFLSDSSRPAGHCLLPWAPRVGGGQDLAVPSQGSQIWALRGLPGRPLSPSLGLPAWCNP